MLILSHLKSVPIIGIIAAIEEIPLFAHDLCRYGWTSKIGVTFVKHFPSSIMIPCMRNVIPSLNHHGVVSQSMMVVLSSIDPHGIVGCSSSPPPPTPLSLIIILSCERFELLRERTVNFKDKHDRVCLLLGLRDRQSGAILVVRSIESFFFPSSLAPFQSPLVNDR
jgi:hypothetical protein